MAAFKLFIDNFTEEEELSIKLIYFYSYCCSISDRDTVSGHIRSPWGCSFNTGQYVFPCLFSCFCIRGTWSAVVHPITGCVRVPWASLNETDLFVYIKPYFLSL